MMNQLDLVIYLQEFPAWWNHPLVIIFLGLVCLFCIAASILALQTIINRRRKKIWNQAYALLKGLELLSRHNEIAICEQAHGMSAILKLCVTYVCQTNAPLSLTDNEFCTFIDENHKIATVCEELKSLARDLAQIKFLATSQPPSNLFERVHALIGQLKLIRR